MIFHLYDPATGQTENYCIGAQPQDIQNWVTRLQQRYGNALVAVCTEQKRGSLIYALYQSENLVLYPINPRTVANYRKAFQPSRAEPDPIDTKLIDELMQRHRDKLDLWVAGCPKHRVLRQWVEFGRMLVGEKVCLTNRITASLKSYFPQRLDWFEDKDTQVFVSSWNAIVERANQSRVFVANQPAYRLAKGGQTALSNTKISITQTTQRIQTTRATRYRAANQRDRRMLKRTPLARSAIGANRLSPACPDRTIYDQSRAYRALPSALERISTCSRSRCYRKQSCYLFLDALRQRPTVISIPIRLRLDAALHEAPNLLLSADIADHIRAAAARHWLSKTAVVAIVNALNHLPIPIKNH